MKESKKKEITYTSFEDYQNKFYPRPPSGHSTRGNQPYELGVCLARESLKKLTDLQD